MKNLLAVVGDGAAHAVLHTVWQLARRFDSRIACLYHPSAERLRWEPADARCADLRVPRQDRQNWAEAGFDRFLRTNGMAAGIKQGRRPDGRIIGPAERQDAPCAVWLAQDAKPHCSLGVLARIYDLIVVARPGSLASLPGVVLEEALLESGRPLLIVPRCGPAVLGERIGIAWNGSTETAHTLALAMPLLVHAREMVVIAVEPRDMPQPGPEGGEIARALARRGMNVALRTVTGRQKRQGEAFLEQAAAAQVDMLVTGAFAPSRLRQMIFGGATRHTILRSSMPVVMGR